MARDVFESKGDQPVAPTFAYFAFFAANLLFFAPSALLAAKSFPVYLNSGMTFSANSRIFFIAISCGMPPK